jgi:hypothetical protein
LAQSPIERGFPRQHLIPVNGSKDEFYIIDPSLTLACTKGVKETPTTVVADLRRLPRDTFWVFLDNRGWLHPGRPRPAAPVPGLTKGLRAGG